MCDCVKEEGGGGVFIKGKRMHESTPLLSERECVYIFALHTYKHRTQEGEGERDKGGVGDIYVLSEVEREREGIMHRQASFSITHTHIYIHLREKEGRQ